LSDIADSAARYVRQMTALESDRQSRAAFQDLAVTLAPAGGRLFDFGAGPGIDALFFAQRGFAVAAYEIDPSMCAYFARYCGEFIAAGRISIDCRDYKTFLRDESAAAVADLIVSDFAPLSLVDDLPELFCKFSTLTGKGGKVLASVLNPYFIGDMRYPWWWRRVPRLRRIGQYVLPSPQGPLTRRRLATLAADCEPYFKLVRIFPGAPSRGRERAVGLDPARIGLRGWLEIAVSRFIFAVFEKRA
jgi:SAM-dependent methyltransferase